MDRVALRQSLFNLLSSGSRASTETTGAADASRSDAQSPDRQTEDRASLAADTSIGRGASGEMGALPWRQSRVPNLGEGYCAAAMAVRAFLHSPETSEAAQRLLEDPQAFVRYFESGEPLRLGNLELRLTPEQIQDLENRLSRGELDESTLGPALLTMGVHNAILERSGTGSATRASFHAVLGDLGLEGTIVKPYLTGAEVGDFVAYGDSVDERHLMRVTAVNDDGTYTLEDAYGVRVTLTEAELMDNTRRAGASDIGYSSALFNTGLFAPPSRSATRTSR